MWENRCKVAVSGVGFSKVTRSAEIPLAAHALEAVKGAGHTRMLANRAVIDRTVSFIRGDEAVTARTA